MATPTEAPSTPLPPNRPARAPRPFPGRSRARALPPHDPSDDSWVDLITAEVEALLQERGLDLELLVFYDPRAGAEMLHAAGYDGSPARYFQCVPGEPASTEPASTPAAVERSARSPPA